MIQLNRDHPGITTITLNRPEKRNALSIALMNELCAALEETHSLTNQRVIIIKGAGPAFCTGLDLKEAADMERAEESATAIAEVLRSIYKSPLVTVAAIQGAAVAGGAGIASVCDYVAAAEKTRFGFPEVQRGLVAALVMTFLRRQLCERDMRELFLFGQLIDVERAKQMHLINEIVPLDQLEETAMKAANQAIKGAPCALTQTKRILDHLYPTAIERDLNQALVYHRLARTHVEAKEGIEAFLEKRQPHWVQCDS